MMNVRIFDDDDDDGVRRIRTISLMKMKMMALKVNDLNSDDDLE